MEPITVTLDDDLGQRVTDAAAERGMSPDQLAREVLDAHVPRQSRHKLSFIGIGASGRPEAAGRNHREILRERFTATTPNDK